MASSFPIVAVGDDVTARIDIAHQSVRFPQAFTRPEATVGANCSIPRNIVGGWDMPIAAGDDSL